ncbi:MAG: cupin domain-containing protein [Myxococcota bacterium]
MLVNPLETQLRVREFGIESVNASLMTWQPIPDAPGNFLKVLSIDRQQGRVDFLFKQAPHAEFARHVHRCTSVTLTLHGRWGYREGDETHFVGTFMYEPPGTTHTPFAYEEGAVLYQSFTGPEGDVFLDLLDADGAVIGHVDLAFFEGFVEGNDAD